MFYDPKKSDEVSKDTSDINNAISEIFELLKNLISNRDFRVSNLAGYSLAHLFDITHESESGSSLLKNDGNIELLKALLIAEYNANNINKADDVYPMCGALRALTRISLNNMEFASCKGIDCETGINKYYKNKWEEYKENPTDRSTRRFLLLYFKPMYLLGCFDESKLSADDDSNPIIYLLKLKYPGEDIEAILNHREEESSADNVSHIGLAYDEEERLISELCERWKRNRGKSET